MKAVKTNLTIYFIISIAAVSCSKSDTSTPNNQSSSLQKQMMNIKWYYDSTVFWHWGDGFSDILDYNGLNQKSYIYFGEDSIMTEYLWTGLEYQQTKYPYVWYGDSLACNYDPFDDFHAMKIKNNQLVVGDLSSDPRKTDTTGQTELLWWYYHK